MDDSGSLEATLVHLARLSLEDRRDDVVALLRRTTRRLRSTSPGLARELGTLLRTRGDRPVASRGAELPIPVDQDSRLELLRREWPVHLHVDPIWQPSVKEVLESVVLERRREDDLRTAGLLPSRSLLFTGPSGLGKTLAARWLASALDRPLFILDLAAIMSSFLGRTGNNIRTVLDYAKQQACVLLLDEFDAIAKRRDDATELGELKRLVTVLLQAVDDWPATGVLVAATNHAELLDPAVWRRFDKSVEFPYPSKSETLAAIKSFLPEGVEPLPETVQLLAGYLQGRSFAEIEQHMMGLLRNSVVRETALESAILRLLAANIKELSPSERLAIALRLKKEGLSQREVNRLTGVARDTLRQHSQETGRSDGTRK